MNILDKTIGALAPRWQLKRERARMAIDLLRRHYYDAATSGRRTQGWRRVIGDANTALGPSLSRLREAARDLVRNNAIADGGILDTITTDAVGWGIVPAAKHEAFRRWSESIDCDADGRLDLAGLQEMVLRTVVESGEVLVRRRWRRPEDGFALPFQLQVLEPDYLDTLRDAALENGGRIIQGVEFDALGVRVAYWIFREHPGSTRAVLGRSVMSGSSRVPASEMLHIFKPGRAGQVRAPSWFASALLKFRDFDEFDDATLMKQKIAACLSVLTSDSDGTAAPLGSVTADAPTVDALEPGMVLNAPPGKTFEIVQPPQARDYPEYSKTVLRTLGRPFGITYEAMTGDYSQVNFSSARMARIGYYSKVQRWRWRILVLQFLNPVWRWAMEAAAIAGLPVVESTEWTAPSLPMIEPDKEGLAASRNVRSGVQTLSEVIRERGYSPEQFLKELANDFSILDELGLVLDCDPRRMTQAGQLHANVKSPVAEDPPPPPEPPAPDETPAGEKKPAPEEGDPAADDETDDEDAQA
jgi:lambda family phage portal protein